MADAILRRRVELGRRLAELGKLEQRVVAESVRPARGGGDRAAPDAFRHERPRIVRMLHEHHYAVIVGASIPLEVAKQAIVIARIALFARPFAPREVRRLHAGRAAERLYAQPGVVGERRQAAGPAGMPCFGERILDERRVRLLGVVDAELRLGYDPHRQGREQRADLAQLAGIARREHQLHARRYSASQ